MTVAVVAMQHRTHGGYVRRWQGLFRVCVWLASAADAAEPREHIDLSAERLAPEASGAASNMVVVTEGAVDETG